jgi:hypothetical protein
MLAPTLGTMLTPGKVLLLTAPKNHVKHIERPGPRRASDLLYGIVVAVSQASMPKTSTIYTTLPSSGQSANTTVTPCA